MNKYDWYPDADAMSREADAEFARLMRRHYRNVGLTILSCTTAAILGIFLASQVKAEIVDGRRIVIIDGDTIDVQGERIRILNIDAPESFRSRCEAELWLLEVRDLARNPGKRVD